MREFAPRHSLKYGCPKVGSGTPDELSMRKFEAYGGSKFGLSEFLCAGYLRGLALGEGGDWNGKEGGNVKRRRYMKERDPGSLSILQRTPFHSFT